MRHLRGVSAQERYLQALPHQAGPHTEIPAEMKSWILRLSVFLLTIVALVSGVNTVCQAQEQSLATRHVREVILNGQARSVGR
ncbi:MAG: hypothetical protein ACLQDV_12180, partial [Candidatus Binataceae bacterium]